MIPSHLAEPCLRFLDERAPIVILLASADGMVKWANTCAARLLGRPPVGTPLRDMFFDPRGSISLPTLARRPEQIHPFHLNIAPAPTQSLYFQVQPLDDDFLLLGCHDPTEQERLQETILALNQELNNSARALAKSNAELDQMLKQRNEFLGMAAHDLRNPAGVIVNFSTFLLKETGDSLSATHREFLQFIHQAARNMASLINQFLDVSIIDSGHLQLRRDWTGLPEIVADAIRYVQLEATEKRIEIVVQRDPNLPVLLIDAPRVRQVLVNLLANAVHYAPPASEVCVECRAIPRGVQVSVGDCGPGIPPDRLKLLFQPFSAADETKTTGERSVGLGLAIAQKIVQEHGGRIWAESVVGQGSTFHFILPAGSED